MDGSPTVSVVMNCYNCERFLAEAIESVYSQTYGNWEIIFWDNCSTDNSSTIAGGRDKRLKYYKSSETTNLGEARKMALSKVTGKYIAFLDCDDVYLPDKLEKQVLLMEREEYCMSYGGAIIINENGKTIRFDHVKYKSGYIISDLLKRYEINMQSVMIRSSVLDSGDIDFKSELKYCPDHNLFMEIASKYPIGVINEYLVKYRVLSNSLSKKTVHLAAKEVQYTLDRILASNPKILSRYPDSVKAAYSKVNYYKAICLIGKYEYKDARGALSEVIFQRWEYLVLYVLLFFPLPSRFVLRLLNR